MAATRRSAVRLLVGGLTCLVVVAPSLAAETPKSSDLLTEKLNAYIGCLNRLSARAFDSRSRYFSWAAKTGPTGKERIVYGTYTIYDTKDCRAAVEKANAIEPHEPDLEAAASAYANAVGKLEPLLKETDDYYTQENYKDDKMAKGKALHPRLVAAWDAFADADRKLRGGVEIIKDRQSAEKLTAIERNEGRKARYQIEATMIDAKRVVRAADAEKPDLTALTAAIDAYGKTVAANEAFTEGERNARIGSMFMSNAKSFLVTAKQLMRRHRDKTPYSSGEKMMLSNAGSGWMVEGSPPRLLRDYNQLVDTYNRGPGF
ncbi:DUF3829 domain-containing protein [Rhodopseudomonas sp. WA056]|uniref:YiiG family protein n=1 Tax=Rhodopseudomonas sp. WA056 TaxID=2269367 RepID=UPI0013DFED51|nr:YiiG family protein [Rhodopseudomonas sp. WA056]NEW85732.1 DUF3829 domain-containing protein [Rhodopseudomonas sp. WA056]